MIEESKRLYLQKPIETRYIIINVVVFLLTSIILFFFHKTPNFHFAYDWLSVPSNLSEVGTKIWTLGTYMFTHVSTWHLVFNMIFLYFSGRIFSDLLGRKKFISMYWLGGFAGAVVFLIGYGLSGKLGVIDRPLLGASASVFAIFIGIATYVPNYTIMLPLIGPAKLKYLAIVFVILSLPTTGENEGGHLAHLGGFMYGLLWAIYMKKGYDLGGWFEKIQDWVVALFTKQPRTAVKKPRPRRTTSKPTSPSQKEIDIILDKVSKSGYESLSKEEKDILFKASK